MRKIVTITLISRTEGAPDEYGNPSYTIAERKIIAERSGVRQAEFYQASAEGLKPEISFLVWEFEYKGEKLIKYQDEEYKILRVGDTNTNGKLELVCYRATAGENNGFA